jgi:hypothetical protein
MAKKADAGGGMSKADMVREALRTLGNAGPKDIQAHISDKYGVTISTTMISSYKSSILRKQGGGGRGAGDATVGVKDLTLLRGLINRVGASQVQTLVKVLSK